MPTPCEIARRSGAPLAAIRPFTAGARVRDVLRALLATSARAAPFAFVAAFTFAAALALPAMVAPRCAFAALIATGDGTGNTSAPNPDPGFARVGSVNGLSAVYARNGWVLTASHVGIGTFSLGGVDHAAVPRSTVRFQNGDGTSADLIAFKLMSRPALADVVLADTPRSVNALLTVIGHGLDRGAATTWMGVDGFAWAGSQSIRWGTNRVATIGEVVMNTQSFSILFDEIANPPAGQHEADIVTGDSGGGAFTGSGTSARLVGILFARRSFVGQPASTSLYGNAGLIVDLYAYRDAILAVVDRPDCGDGLDDDGDGLIDFPGDPGCASADDANERAAALVCDNGLDDDGDGLIDFPTDPGCVVGTDVSERGAPYQCDNGIDDDGDLLIDFPADPGCLHPTNPVEAPEPGAGLMLGAGVLALIRAARARARSREPSMEPARQTSSTRSTR